MNVHKVIDISLYEVANKFIDRLTIRRHYRRTKLYLGLRLENRFLNINGDGGNHTISDVAIFVFPEEFFDSLGYMLLKCTLMSTSLRGVLSVYERVIFLSVLVCMCKGNLNVIAFHVNNGVKRVYSHIVGEQVLQSVATENAMPIIHNGKSCVQVGVVSQHSNDNVVLETVILKERVVGLKVDVSALFIVRFRRFIGLLDTFFERQ